ncbi:D-hexose-6-phosphate mutarotase [Granulicoccus phenolivorans]|uniref:D-hexose-6-phosphate mutarotase n=1 Tax=Granulicoccus phenolivorans TaxID=266854 RepID=UPI00041124EE|nr:D-hexose-6-phosphate mutarotase [Granulicoccus phenolivorans]
MIELPEAITLETGRGGLPVVKVATAAVTGEVYLLGAHVTAWTPAGEAPVLWVSEQSNFLRGTPIRGGVPVCAPWFGPGRHGDKQPAHGWFRISDWELTGAEVVDDEARLTFALTGPGGISAEYRVLLGRSLHLDLSVTAGADPLDLEEATHAYFAVSDIHGVRVDGLAGAHYVDKAPGGASDNVELGPVTFTGETDRVYAHTGPATVIDPDGRHITLSKHGSNNTVVWNPWVDKAAAMGDFGDDEWPGMMCLEAANALDGYVALQPGETHTMQVTYALS